MVQFTSYLRRVLCKTRLIFPRINGPIVAKTRSRMTTAITFSRQNDADSRVRKSRTRSRPRLRIYSSLFFINIYRFSSVQLP